MSDRPKTAEPAWEEVSDKPHSGQDASPRGESDPASAAGRSHHPMLQALCDPALDPLFWPAMRLEAPSAWWTHVPFAHWIVRAAAPRVFVELGTFTGVSYSAFCRAVSEAGLPTQCHAVDSWHGDRHAGEYGEEVYEDYRRCHDSNFAAYSTLLRCDFDAALGWFADGAIDLLHIDGLHTYEAVRHDFANWMPKMSERGVVLLHDTNVRQQDFGVWRFWGELREEYPSFEFLHGYGLGVVAVGRHPPNAVAALCRLDEPAEIAALRHRFATLGERWSQAGRAAQASLEAAALRAEVAGLRAEVARLQAEAADAAAQAEVAASQARLRDSAAETPAAARSARPRRNLYRRITAPLRDPPRLLKRLRRRGRPGRGPADA